MKDELNMIILLGIAVLTVFVATILHFLGVAPW